MATKRTKRETKEKKKQASPPFRLPGAPSQKTKNKIKIWGKTKQKRGGRWWPAETSGFILRGF
jgi:hypothetical protein